MKKLFAISLFFYPFLVFSQSTKPKSYIISKQNSYTIEVKDDKPSIDLFSEEKKWVGDKDDNKVIGDRIDYTSTFEELSEIEAYSISPEKRKEKVRLIESADVEIEDIFYHDMKYKYFYFPNLKDGSETYCSYKKQFKVPQLLDTYYFKDNLDCKESKLTLKVSKDVEVGYTLHGNDTDKVLFTKEEEGNYTILSWELNDTRKEEQFEDAPGISYYSPHLIYYIKNYKTTLGNKQLLGSVENLYKYYYQTIKDINKTDASSLKTQTEEIIKGLTSESEKIKAIFDFVQTKVHYVAFEDGMGGFIPREATDVLQKRYGDCKDMANLLNEMLHIAKIESYIAWIGTRQNNYTYEKVPTPITDNHMIAVAKSDNKYLFLDATGQYTIFPSFTPFIQGKEALLKIDESNYKILPVPVIPAENNNTSGKIKFRFEENKLIGNADFNLIGFSKTQFTAWYKNSLEKDKMLKEYLARFIENMKSTNIEVKNDDVSQNPLELKNNFELEKWIKRIDNQIVFKPILFFPISNSRIDIEERKVPMDFDYKKSYDFEYEIQIPQGYKLEFKPDDFNFLNDLISATITYSLKNDKIVVDQHIKNNVLLLNVSQFEQWNIAIKNITKQYNQNIILTK